MKVWHRCQPSLARCQLDEGFSRSKVEALQLLLVIVGTSFDAGIFEFDELEIPLYPMKFLILEFPFPEICGSSDC